MVQKTTHMIGSKTKKVIAGVLAVIYFALPFTIMAFDVSTGLDNVMAHWELEETSGTRVDSDTDTAYDLTDNNTTGSGTGKQGTAADFTPNDNLSRAASGDWGYRYDGSAANDNLSASFWFKADSVAGACGQGRDLSIFP